MNGRSLDRIINYGMGIVVIYLFVMEGRAEDHGYILAGLVLSIILGYIAFLLNWLTLDATHSVIILGTIVFGFGGWLFSIAVLFFFISSSLLTQHRREQGYMDSDIEPAHYYMKKRRDGYQVWANGFWMAVFVILWFISSAEVFLLAAFATLATATADTWATELGSVRPGKTRIITTGKVVKSGTDGGISLKGTLAAFAGSLAIAAIIYLPGGDMALMPAIMVFAGGFLGCIVDSYLGAFIQNRDASTPTPELYSELSHRYKNSLVNWISTGIGGSLTLLFTQIIHV